MSVAGGLEGKVIGGSLAGAAARVCFARVSGQGVMKEGPLYKLTGGNWAKALLGLPWPGEWSKEFQQGREQRRAECKFLRQMAQSGSKGHSIGKWFHTTGLGV